MKTAKELEVDFKEAREGLEKLEKLNALRSIRGGLHEIERAAAADLAFPLTEIQSARTLLPDVETALTICEANAKRWGWSQ
jgi:hypothetical protein